jgi:hypothetical protein
LDINSTGPVAMGTSPLTLTSTKRQAPPSRHLPKSLSLMIGPADPHGKPSGPGGTGL